MAREASRVSHEDGGRYGRGGARPAGGMLRSGLHDEHAPRAGGPRCRAVGPRDPFPRDPLGPSAPPRPGRGPGDLADARDWAQRGGLAGRAGRPAGQRHRVVGFDYYGHGLSDRAHGLRYGPVLWVQQAMDVLDALGIERVTVVGHSVGGSVAAMFTADHPDRVERSVFIGHGIAMDPMQWVPFVPAWASSRWPGRRSSA